MLGETAEKMQEVAAEAARSGVDGDSEGDREGGE